MEIAVISVFIAGYIFIVLEHFVRVNKAATALVTGVLCWTLFIMGSDNKEEVSAVLTEHMGDLSGILFFLLGAMTLVELIDRHDGFNIITERIVQRNKVKLLWIISLITFFMSPLLDNLTTTIFMVTLLRKIIHDPVDRMGFTGIVVVAANAGGAWSPMGDVTTTMLWIGGQVSAPSISLHLFLPSLACLIVPVWLYSRGLSGNIANAPADLQQRFSPASRLQQKVVFYAGVLVLLLVPAFKLVTHLPPFMAMLVGLGIIWIVTEIMHGNMPERERNHLSVGNALQKIDTPSILFFLGILLSIASLEVMGTLAGVAEMINANTGSHSIIAIALGLLSAIVDNVPLVAASQAMYSLDVIPPDHYFWEFLAYTTGTGGSVLIVGSAAGVAAMGIEKIRFITYLKRIAPLAFAGFVAGAGVYMLQSYIISAVNG